MARRAKKVAQREPDEKYEYPLSWPEELFHHIQEHAVRCDESLSFIVQHSWTTAYSQVAASDRETLEAAIRTFGGRTIEQPLFYKGSMIAQFEEQAARLGVTDSFVAQAAVVLAQAEIEKLPTVTGFE